jgi:hypothetical protein
VKIRRLLLILLPLFPSLAAAQQDSRTESYLIPQTVYVGDRARLVIHLGPEFDGTAPFTLQEPPGLARQKEIRIHQLELDHRRGNRETGEASGTKGGAGTSRLLVDFTPYAPGLIELPPLSLAGGAVLTGFQVNIASVLGSGDDPLVLSEPAPPLPAPGAIPLILGTALGLLILLLGGTGAGIWARKNLGGLLETRRKRRLVALMRKTERRFRRGIGNGGDYRAMLGLVSAEFRNFLGRFTGYNCMAMSAGEFFTLPSLFPPDSAETGADSPARAPDETLGPFFRNLDRLRYSGENPDASDMAGVLDGVRDFTGRLERALGGKAAG